VDSPSGFTSIFVLHENIHVTRLITTAEVLGTMFKNNLANVGELTLLLFMLSAYLYLQFPKHHCFSDTNMLAVFN